MADERTRPLYVVPDTNYLLHGRPLGELTPALLGLQGPITAWILVMTVVDELDELKYESRVARKRAAYALDYLYDNEGPAKLAAGVPVEDAVPRAPIAYDALGFDSTIKDEKICAQIKDFEAAHPEADVILLTLDNRMRGVRAKRHNIAVVKGNFALKLRIADEDDPVLRELEELRREKRLREKAAPNLRLSFADESRDLALPVFPEFTNEISELILEGIRRWEINADSFSSTVVKMMLGASKPNPYYQDQYKRYEEQLWEKLPQLWTATGRSHVVALTLANDGEMQANEVAVFITTPDCLQVVDEITEAPEFPKKPRTHLPHANVFADAMQANRGNVWGENSDIIRVPIRTTPIVPIATGPDVQEDGSIKYWQRSLAQRARVALKKLVFELTSLPDAMQLKYAISAANIIGRHESHVLVRPVVKDKEAAIDAVVRKIVFA